MNPSLNDLLLSLRETAEALSRNEPLVSVAPEIRALLDSIESATPGGVPLHGQLDTVRKWLNALEEPAGHERFGGEAHLRSYVLTQLRLTQGALEDYRREMK